MAVAVDCTWGNFACAYEFAAGESFSRDRYLDPSTGKWLQPDRLGLRAGPNRYQYVRGAPTLFKDPSGKIRYGGWPAPDEGWVPLPSEEDSLMRVDVDYAAQIALVGLDRAKILGRVRGYCSKAGVIDFNIATAAQISEESIVWRRVQTRAEIVNRESAPAGEAVLPLGQRPYRIALSDSYTTAAPDFSVIGTRDPRLGLTHLARTILHEWLHHIMRLEHAPGMNPDVASERAADLPYSLSEEAIP